MQSERSVVVAVRCTLACEGFVQVDLPAALKFQEHAAELPVCPASVVTQKFYGENNATVEEASQLLHESDEINWTPSEHASGNERIAVGGGRRNNPRAAHETPRAIGARMVLVPHGWCGSNDANE